MGNFRGMAREPSQNFSVIIFASISRNHTHPPQALHVKYRCVGVSNFRVDCSALEKLAPRKNFPLYPAIYTVHENRWSRVYIYTTDSLYNSRATLFVHWLSTQIVRSPAESAPECVGGDGL